MNIGFSSITAVYDPFDWVYELEDIGFTGWEIVCEGDMRLTKELRKRIESFHESTNLDLSIHAPFSDLNLASINYPIWEETVRQIRSCIENSPDRAKVVTIHPGHLSPLGAQMPEKAWKQMVEALKKLTKCAVDRDITLGLENMVNINWLFGRFPHEIDGLVETVNSGNMGITFDIGHANLTDSIDEFLKLDFIHVHAHDNFGKTDEHLSIGKGEIDWRRVIDGLNDYKGSVVIEAKSLEEGKESFKFLNTL
ncbi:MAG: sugar phosphate isomerase/epimerase family protein [Halobacteriota archaeon]|nr:sugar phosphate isomerase/epimerase family protein [Halobacteriota archaeon]